MRHSILPLLSLILLYIPLNAQIAVGQWRDHLPYSNGRMVADAGNLIYYAGEDGLISYHKTDGDIQRLSKINGMSDVGYAAIAFSKKNNTLVVAYTNTNLDLLKDNALINIPDIRDKQILGNKVINNIHIDGDFAYLACGFGIVVVDLAREEIKETYIIGEGSTPVNVLDISSSSTELFACTENGVLRAQKSGVNLLDFASWVAFDQLPEGRYNTGTYFNGRLYVNITDTPRDTLYYLDGGQWHHMDNTFDDRLYSLESTDNRLLMAREWSAVEYDAQHQRLRLVTEYASGMYARPKHLTHDSKGFLWIADRDRGLMRVNVDYSAWGIGVNGPSTTRSFNISIWDKRCYVAGGGFNAGYNNLFDSNGYFTFKDNEWRNVSPMSNPQTSHVRDIVRVLTDPFDSRRVYAATWRWGLLEYYDDELVAVYDTSNSSIKVIEGTDFMRVSGMAMERNGTLWLAGSESGDLLYAKSAGGDWFGYRFNVIANITLGDIAIDNIGQKWVVLPRGRGLLVFNDNGTLADQTDDRAKALTQSVGNGNLPSMNVTAVAADLNGQIWVGTDIGIGVFYSPQSVFSDNNFDSQRILVQQDGYVQYLLDNERVTTIQVDGANRKWIGTERAGVFLMSPDGTEEILHFTEANSPLFSNNITAIGIDHISGEVFIGTDKGMLSYRGTATYGEPEFEKEKVYAFPNPVRHDYQGPIAIKGLVRDADVKITDMAGRTVFATRAEGGQAIWDGRSFGGNRAKSGIYLVFASNDDGSETFVTKVLFIQ